MTVHYITTNTIGDGWRMNLPENSGQGDDVVVNSGVIVGSHNSSGIVGWGSNHSVTIKGLVSGEAVGIYLGNSYSDYGNTVRVGQGGSVTGTYGVALYCSASSLVNEGEIFGHTAGVWLSVGQGSTSTMTNAGVIFGSDGIQVVTDGSGTAKFTNYGRLEGTYNAYSGSWSTDVFVNRGIVKGTVALGSGNDTYDGRGGTVEGTVYGEWGDDLFFAGNEAEVFDGGAGFDTLDFRSSGGLRVSLMDDSGTGRAEGDIYSGFERILGSAGGADELIGNDLANTLEGRGGNDALLGNGGNDLLLGGGGNDTLLGGADHDTLDGGAGADRLEGGTGDDVYLVTASNDTVVEDSDAGIDEVRAGDSHQLSANVENLVLTGSSAINGTGNGLGNRLSGNGAVNALDGAAGKDCLLGGGGADTLTGGAGNDAFEFNGVWEGGDLITDFGSVAGDNDLFRINAAGFGGDLVAGGLLDPTRFQSRADNLAQDSDDRFIFRTTDRTLWFDVDGDPDNIPNNGSSGAAAVLIADLQAGAVLTAADILLV